MLSPAGRKLAHGACLQDDDLRCVEGMLNDVRAVPRGADVVREGEKPTSVHVVMEGLAYRYKVVPDGGRQIMALLVPGDFCDLHVHILGEMDHNIAALSPCRVAFIPAETVRVLTNHSEELSRALWWATLVDEAVLREWLVGMGRRSADRRIAHLFCELLYRMRAVGLAEGDAFDFALTQDELGDATGLSAVHVNRVLQKLRGDGLIQLEGRTLTVLDAPRLVRFADFDASYLHLGPRSPREGPAEAPPQALH